MTTRWRWVYFFLLGVTLLTIIYMISFAGQSDQRHVYTTHVQRKTGFQYKTNILYETNLHYHADVHYKSHVQYKTGVPEVGPKNISSFTTPKEESVISHNPETKNLTSKFKLESEPEAKLPIVMDSIRDTAITMQEINANVANCQRKSLARSSDCAEVYRNPRAFWRSTDSSRNYKEDVSRMEQAARCCSFNHTELMSPAPAPSLYAWEKDYLSQGPLTDMRDTAWSSESSVHLLTPDSGPFRMGQLVQLLVQVRTGRDKPRTVGGDIVRVWLVGRGPELEASVAAEVKDNGNGTYLATVRLPWAGEVVVKATVSYTRELFRATLYVLRLFTTFHWLMGVFRTPSISEATPCSPLPAIPAFPASEVCNMTDMNGGIPWYCGRPVKKQLKCQDWYATLKISKPSPMPLNDVDEKLIQLTETKRPFMIPNNLVLDVQKDDQSNANVIETPSLSCLERNLSTTFDDVISTGFYYKQEWFPFACRLPVVDKAFLLKCLTNTTMIILGDSNSRVQIDNLQAMTDCVHKIPRHKVVWHAPLKCEIDSLNMSIQYYPPKNPFYGSVGEVVTNPQLTSFIAKLDSIPNRGRYLVHVHQFLHLVNSHLSIAERRVRHLRVVLARLLARNPEVVVVVQSVHAAYDNMLLNKHKMNPYLFEMQRTVLRGLGDRVMFVNTLDLTVAMANNKGHPVHSQDFTKLYMGHVCGRL